MNKTKCKQDDATLVRNKQTKKAKNTVRNKKERKRKKGHERYSRTSADAHLSTTAPFFRPGGQKTHTMALV